MNVAIIFFSLLSKLHSGIGKFENSFPHTGLEVTEHFVSKSPDTGTWDTKDTGFECPTRTRWSPESGHVIYMYIYIYRSNFLQIFNRNQNQCTFNISNYTFKSFKSNSPAQQTHFRALSTLANDKRKKRVKTLI